MANQRIYNTLLVIGLDADKPVIPFSCFFYLSTDIDGGTLYVWDGTTWVQMAKGVTA